MRAKAIDRSTNTGCALCNRSLAPYPAYDIFVLKVLGWQHITKVQVNAIGRILKINQSRPFVLVLHVTNLVL